MKSTVTPAGQSIQPSTPGGEQGKLLSLQDEKPRLCLLSSRECPGTKSKEEVASHMKPGDAKDNLGRALGIVPSAGKLVPCKHAGVPGCQPGPWGSSPSTAAPAARRGHLPTCLGPGTAARALSHGSASPDYTMCSTTSSPDSTASPRMSASFSSPHSLKLQLPRSHN